MPFVKPTQLLDGAVSDAPEKLSEKGAKVARVLEPNSVLVSCIGNLGKTAINGRKVAFNQQINAAVFNEGVEPKYGFYFFQSSSARRQLENLSSATTIAIVNKSKFQSVKIPIAPLPEQRRIVARIEELFSRLDAGVAALRQAKAQLKRYRQSVLAAAVTGQLTQAWREQKVAEASRLSSQDHQRQDASATPRFTESQIHWLKVIRDYVALNGAFATDDQEAYLDAWQSVDSDEGVPLAVANRVFGTDALKPIIEELNEVLVA
jgi:hypothetical protein